MPNVQPLTARLQVVYGPPPVPEPPPTFEQGYEEGLAQGRAIAHEEQIAHAAMLQAKVDVELAKLAEQCKFKYQEWLTSMEEPIAGLSVAIAAKIIGQEIESRPDVIDSWVRQALAEVTSESHMTLRVPAGYWNDSMKSDHASVLEVIPDPTIAAGCVIETEHGMIDARIDTMLAEALLVIREAA